MLSAGGQTDGPGGMDPAPGPVGADHGHHHPDVDVEEAIASLGGAGPIRLLLLGLFVLLLGIVLRWGQDVTAPYINVAEAEMASPVSFESDGGTYRVVTSGPTRPPLRATVCEARGSDGKARRKQGLENVDGGHTRLGVTRAMDFELPPGPVEIRCGDHRPTGGAGLGRFQVVDADGPMTIAVTGLLGVGGVSVAGAVGWFLLRLGRRGI